jgi:gamma-butyrobetaine dioxygenase
MSDNEAAAFLAAPFAREAITLRRWDDEAKIPDLTIPSLETYRTLLHRLWQPAG